MALRARNILFVMFDQLRSDRLSCTLRHVRSHGGSWTGVPLEVVEMTRGDHLRPLGMGTWLIGKTPHAGGC